MSSVKRKTRRVMITIDDDVYCFLVSHFIKLSPICNQALKDAITEWRAESKRIRMEIPSNCVIQDPSSIDKEHEIHDRQ